MFGTVLTVDEAWAEEPLDPVRSPTAILFTQTLDLGTTAPEDYNRGYKRFFRTYDKARHSTTQAGVDRWNWCAIEVDGVGSNPHLTIPQGRIFQIGEGMKGGDYTSFPLFDINTHETKAYLTYLYNSLNPVGLNQLPKILLEDTLKVSFEGARAKLTKEKQL